MNGCYEDLTNCVSDLDDDFADLTEMYGLVARGQRCPLVTQFSSFLYSMSGDWVCREPPGSHQHTGSAGSHTDASSIYANVLDPICRR